MRAIFKKIGKNIKHNRERGVHSGEVQARLADWREGGVGRRVCLCSDWRTKFVHQMCSDCEVFESKGVRKKRYHCIYKYIN